MKRERDVVPRVIAFIVALLAGVYLVVNGHPVLGGWVCVLSLLATWGFESSGSDDEEDDE